VLTVPLRGRAGSMDWASVIPSNLLVATIGLVYSSIYPLCLPFVTLYFAVCLGVYKHNLLFVYERPFETGGLMWPIIVTRLVFGMVLYHVRSWASAAAAACGLPKVQLCCGALQVTVIGVLGLNEAAVQSAALLPLPLVCLAFSWYLHKYRLDRGTFLPAEVEQNHARLAAMAVTNPLVALTAAVAVSHDSETPLGVTVDVQHDGVRVCREYLPPSLRPECDMQLWDAEPAGSQFAVCAAPSSGMEYVPLPSSPGAVAAASTGTSADASKSSTPTASVAAVPMASATVAAGVGAGAGASASGVGAGVGAGTAAGTTTVASAPVHPHTVHVHATAPPAPRRVVPSDPLLLAEEHAAAVRSGMLLRRPAAKE
jgi:hypothetical protein